MEMLTFDCPKTSPPSLTLTAGMGMCAWISQLPWLAAEGDRPCGGRLTAADDTWRSIPTRGTLGGGRLLVPSETLLWIRFGNVGRPSPPRVLPLRFLRRCYPGRLLLAA